MWLRFFGNIKLIVFLLALDVSGAQSEIKMSRNIGFIWRKWTELDRSCEYCFNMMQHGIVYEWGCWSQGFFNLGVSGDVWRKTSPHAVVWWKGIEEIFCAVACAYVCLGGGAAPHLRGFFSVCLTTKHKPFCQTNGCCVGERGRPRPKLQRWAHFDSCSYLVIIPPSHSRIFGLPKVFLSLRPFPPPAPPPPLHTHSFSLCVSRLWLAVMTEPSLGCQPPLKLSLITPFH